MQKYDMAKVNPLQEQLIKAGLAKKSKAAEVARITELRAQARQIIVDKKVPRSAAEMVRERDASMIVLDHAQDVGSEPSTTTSKGDAYYAQFQVPDDLVW